MNHSGDQLIDPVLLFEKARLMPTMHIADFGCGRTGHILFPALSIIGESGVAYGVDILKEALESIRRRAQLSNVHNVYPIWSNIEWLGKTAIPEQTLDTVFLINVLCFIDNRHGVLEEAYRLLKDKARIVIVDWQKDGLSFAPKIEQLVDFQNIRDWAALHRMAAQEEFEAGPYHKGIVLYKHD